MGWISAAIVNYLGDVLPHTRALSSPVCSKCGRSTPWYTLLGPARCGSCQARASLRTWVTFISGVAVSILMWMSPPARLGYYPGMLWMAYFGLVVIIDLEHRLILHPISLVGGILALVHGSLLHGVLYTLLGGVVGFGVMLLFYYLGGLFIQHMSRIRGETTEQIALGFGDVNLAGVMGLLLGFPGITLGLVIAILIGGLVSAVYLLTRLVTRRYTAFEALPYGPFLVLSAVYLLYIA